MSDDLTTQAAQLLASAGLDQPAPSAAPAAPAAPSADSATSAVQQSTQRQVAILADIENGDSYTAIAAKHGVAVSTVSRIAARAELFTEGARKYLAAKAFGAVDAWQTALHAAARRGDHRPAKDLLLHSGVIEPLADTSGQRGTNIAIVIGEPGAPIRVSASKDEG